MEEDKFPENEENDKKRGSLNLVSNEGMENIIININS